MLGVIEMDEQEKINQFLDEWIYKQIRRKYSNEFYFNDNYIFSSITSKDQVKDASEFVEYRISQISQIPILYKEDIESIEKLIARYEISVSKVIQCYASFDFNYSYNELKNLVEKIFYYYDKVSDLEMRRLCQD